MVEIEHDIEHVTINGAEYKNLIISSAQGLEDNKEEINNLNVFPVPDGDTGSNMAMTVAEAAKSLEKSGTETLSETANATAKAMLHGARGNSGVITSLIFRGISKVLETANECDGKIWAKALMSGAELAYSSVDKPAEGTILTVVKYSAEMAQKAAKKNNSFEFVLKSSIDAAEEALENTVNQNPVLEKAGVVDAGGMGWLVMMKAMYMALVTGQTATLKEKPSTKLSADFTSYETEDITFAFCTEFIVRKHAPEQESNSLKAYLSTMGDSIVMVDDGEIIKTHIHTNEPHQVLGKALEYGVYETVKVENMKSQHTNKIGASVESVPSEPPQKYGIVSVASGEGFTQLFVELGANEIVSGGQTMNPSTDDIYNAVSKINAETIFIFPNNKNIILAANQVQDLTDKNIIVIPTTSVPQGISALLAFDADMSAEENLEAMTDVMSTVTTMQITYAAKDSSYNDMQIKQGDYLGIINKELFTSPDLDSVISSFAEKINSLDGQMLSIYYGQDVTEEDAQAVCDKLTAKLSRDVEVNLCFGGQAVYYYVISLE